MKQAKADFSGRAAWRGWYRHRLSSVFACAVAVLHAGPALADPASITITPDQPLRFGTLLVPVSGSRTLGVDGSISDSGLFDLGASAVGPAQFTLTYDTGNNGNRNVTVLVQVLFSGLQTTTVGGVTARLSQLSSDLSGPLGSLTGSVATITIANCRQRRCSVTFHIGARLDVTRSSGGAELVFPLPASASILAVL